MKKTLFISIIIACSLSANKSMGQTPNDTVTARQLQEVVVKASRPVSKLETDGIVTTVQGTVLQQLGTARDVLGFLPGVTPAGGGIEVIGKGVPVIYINGRQVYAPQEIDQLHSSRIKNVVVITNPGARYASDVNAVIKIMTIKDLGDGMALDNRAVGGFNNHFYATDVLWMNYRKGGLDFFSTLQYDYSKKRGNNDVAMSNISP